MLPVKVPPNLPELVRTAFSKARANGDVHFYPTQVTILEINSLPFQLRFSPALANKPKAPVPAPAPAPVPAPMASSPKPIFDPFDNPPAALLVTPLPPTHNLVLNKFAVVPEHFILATQAFAPQTHLLQREDLEATYACIGAYNDKNKDGQGARDGLFAFFNSGDGSGASQPHRHIQLLPVARMRDELEPNSGWDVLARRLGDGSVRERLPFRVFAKRIHPAMDGDAIREVYMGLYRQACAAMGVDAAGQDAGEARISYNLAMTEEVMVVMPRVVEGGEVSGAEGVVGSLALNGTVLAGTALVKTQKEWDVLRTDPGRVAQVLGRIGLGKEGGRL